MYILLHILLPYGLLQTIEYSSLCYTVGPCWLSILYIANLLLLNKDNQFSKKHLLERPFFAIFMQVLMKQEGRGQDETFKRMT